MNFHLQWHVPLSQAGASQAGAAAGAAIKGAAIQLRSADFSQRKVRAPNLPQYA